MYEKYNDLIEKLSKLFYLALMYIGGPVFILPKVILSYFHYYTTDSGRDAFELPLEMWLVNSSICFCLNLFINIRFEKLFSS